ncbi:hypothetical protein BH20ACT16_BH20ACT16_10690 [soil metagenome]|jgi:hypothetical protein
MTSSLNFAGFPDPRPQTAVVREWRREQRGRKYGI